MLLRSLRATKQKPSPWRSKERVVQDGVLVYAVGSPIPREEAVRQGLVEEKTADDEKPAAKKTKRRQKQSAGNSSG